MSVITKINSFKMKKIAQNWEHFFENTYVHFEHIYVLVKMSSLYRNLFFPQYLNTFSYQTNVLKN